MIATRDSTTTAEALLMTNWLFGTLSTHFLRSIAAFSPFPFLAGDFDGSSEDSQL